MCTFAPCMKATDSLSILIPTHNDTCVTLVDTLRHQADSAGISYEIIVADDGSTTHALLQGPGAPGW